ncbi:MAG: transposase [Blautia massiliensis (ex Durand et al. 2017)]|uniref:transposase n=1 Tax=Blautia TaxID=572511 RepID=UPI002589A865
MYEKAGVRKILKKLCDYWNIEIVEGAVCADHVHFCLIIPPNEKVSDVVGYIKGKVH